MLKNQKMKKDAFYFPHDSNAKDDPKVVMMIEQLGLESYGIFWVLVEILRDQPDFKYPLALIPAIARRYNTTAEKVKAVVMSYGLFQIENDEFFFSRSLNNRMLPMLEKREQARQAANKRWEKQKQLTEKNNESNANAMRTHSDSNAHPMPKREEKKKEEKSIPELDVFLAYSIEHEPLIDKKSVELKYKSWVANGWKDGNNRSIDNWESKLLNTIPHLKKNDSADEPKRGFQNDYKL
jgi:uncharacterized protein YdaU (DUF1376 family)